MSGADAVVTACVAESVSHAQIVPRAYAIRLPFSENDPLAAPSTARSAIRGSERTSDGGLAEQVPDRWAIATSDADDSLVPERVTVPFSVAHVVVGNVIDRLLADAGPADRSSTSEAVRSAQRKP